MRNTIYRCPVCGSSNLIYFPERGEIVCAECGVVVEDKMIDKRPEWRAFTHEQLLRRKRTGPPGTFSIHDKGLTTTIDSSNRDYQGRRLSFREKIRVKRLIICQKRMRAASTEEKKLIEILSRLNHLTSTFQLPATVNETAAIILRKAIKARMIRGKIYDDYIAAAIYLACRKLKISRTLDEIAKTINVPRKKVAQQYRKLVTLLRKKPPPSNPVNYVPKLLNMLNLPAYVQTKAAEILSLARERGITSGKGPIGLAAAAIYIASVLMDEKRTQREVADAAGITEVTVRNRYKELIDALDFEVRI